MIAGAPLGTRFRAFLGLSEGEGPRALRLVSLIFVMSLGLVLLKAAQSGIFLVAYPRSMIPWAFAASAVLLATLSMGTVPLAARLGPSRLAGRTLIASAAAVLALRAALHLRVPHAKFALYVVIEALCGVLLIQVWSVVSEATNARSAKRLLPVAGIGASTAWTLGGLLVPLITRLLSASALLVLAPALFLTAFAIVRRVMALDLGEQREKGRARAGMVAEWRAGLSFVRRVPLMRVGVILSVLALLTEQLMDFQLMSAARERYGAPGDCAAFFGTYYGVTSAVSIVLLIGLSGRLLSTLGATKALAMTPGLTVVAALTAVITPIFPVIVALRATDRVLKQSTWSAAMEQTQTPLPVVRRTQARALTRGVLAPLAYALAAVCLAMVPEHVELRWLALVTASLCLVMTLAIAVGVRRSYESALRRAIDDRSLDLDRAPASTLDADACRAVARELMSADEGRASLAAEVLGSSRTPLAIGALRAGLMSPSPAVRGASAEGLAQLTATGATDAIAALASEDPDAQVRRVACEALRRLTPLPPRARAALARAEDDPDPEVAAAAVVTALLDRGEDMLHLLDAEPRAAQAALAALPPAMGQDVRAHERLARVLAPDVDVGVRRAAIAAISRLRVTPLLPRLIALVDDADVGADVAVELANWDGAGDPAASARGDADVASPGRNPRARGRVLERGDRAPLGRTLLDPLLEREVSQAYRLHAVLAGVAHDDGKPDWTVDPAFAFLGGELERRIGEAKLRILRLLALLGRRDVVRAVEFGMREDTAAMDARVAELLELSLDADLARRVVPLFDRITLRERASLARRLGYGFSAEVGDPLHALVELDDPHLLGAAAVTYRERFRSRFPSVYDALSPVIPLFERMTFLRTVPLFSGLSGDDLRLIAERVAALEVHDGDLVFKKGDPGDDLYLVLRGELVVRDGNTEIARVGEREFFGELSVLDHEPRSADVVAERDATLLRLRRADLAELMQRRPRIQEAILLVLVRRLRAVNQRVAQ